MRFQEYGPEQKDTILLLHGGGLSWWNYREAAKLLQGEYHVILPVMDGHSGSDRPFTTIEDNASEIISFIDEHLNGFALMIGRLSLGAQILLEILVVANKFQTGFDEPLLHTMYVDKGLSDIKAVQTLSRLNRSHPDKKDTFILDFVNDPEIIKQAFDRYYKTTILSGETDVNKLNDLIDTMESIQVYTEDEVNHFVELYLNDAPREELDPILDHCVEVYKGLTIEEQIEFKSCAKSFSRTYNFLAAILPYGSVQWEKLAIFLKLLVPKLPSPEGEDYTEGLLEDVDLESYRAEAREIMQIRLDDENGEINPIPVSTDVGIDVQELDTLSNILKEFHDIFGKIDWTDEDKIRKQIADLPEIVSRDETYQNAMRYSDKQNARAESDRATGQAILATMSSGIELYREVQSNESFRRWILDMVFNATYNPPVAARTTKPWRVVYRTEPEKTLMVAEPSSSYGKKDKDDKH